jgi:parvulin-like peptidyl-prolyl isomerase
MTHSGRFALRLAIYTTILGFVAADLLLFEGPLHRRLKGNPSDSPEAIAAAKAAGAVARVFGHPIVRSQLDRAVHERLNLEGRNAADVAPQELTLIRYAALGDLIDHELLRVKAKVNHSAVLVSPEEIDSRYADFASRFGSPEALLETMVAQGIPDQQALRERIAARIQQEKYVEMRIGPLVSVSDEEVAEWYEKHREALALPERISARHVFLRNQGRSSDDARETLAVALASLRDGTAEFAEVALKLSEDAATRESGGALGWMTRARLPEDFAAQVFDLPLHEPQLVRTRLGWHLVEVTERKPMEVRALKVVEPEIRAALVAIKRREAAEEFRAALRQHEETRGKVEIFHDMLKQ